MVMTYQLQPTPQYTPARYVPARDVAAQHSVAQQGADVRHSERLSSRRSVTPGAAIAVVVIILAAVLGFGSDAAATGTLQPASGASEVADTIEIYVVQPGDTLWAIASSIAMPGEDVRPLVDALQVVSGGSNLEVGQRLIIDHTMIRR